MKNGFMKVIVFVSLVTVGFLGSASNGKDAVYIDDGNYGQNEINLGDLIQEDVKIVNAINDLRALDPQELGAGLSNQRLVFVKNHSNVFDYGGGFFYWRPTSVSISDTKNKALMDNDGTVIHTCKNNKGFWQRENSQSYYNVLWFGARSNHNGGTQVNPELNRLAFQKAIYFASIRSSYVSKLGKAKGTAKSAPTIYIPFGEYELTNFGDSQVVPALVSKCADRSSFNNYPPHQFGAQRGKAVSIKDELTGVTIKGDRATVFGEVDSQGNLITNAFYYDNAKNQHTIEGLEFVDFNEAISFDTSNTSLTLFKVKDCSFFSCNLGITSRQYQFRNSKGQDDGSRSTNFIIDGVKMHQVKRIIESTTDLLLIQNCFFNQYKPDRNKGESHQPMMFINSGATILNSIFIPSKGDLNVEGAYWIDFNFTEDPKSRYLNIIGSRFSGENGGISVVKVTAAANSLNASVLSQTNQVFISFVNSKLHSARGGASNGFNGEGKGGIVTLAAIDDNKDGVLNSTATPNLISFYNTTSLISGSIDRLVNNQIIVSENAKLPLHFNKEEDFSFKIFIDQQSMQAYDKNWSFNNSNWFPVGEELLPYLNRQTRGHLMNRLQTLSAIEFSSPSILKGNKIAINADSKNSLGQNTINNISHALPGDKVTFIGSQIENNDKVLFFNQLSNRTNNPKESIFILSEGDKYELGENGIISFILLDNGKWLEISRN